MEKIDVRVYNIMCGQFLNKKLHTYALVALITVPLYGAFNSVSLFHETLHFLFPF